jgi:hypothetical protein
LYVQVPVTVGQGTCDDFLQEKAVEATKQDEKNKGKNLSPRNKLASFGGFRVASNTIYTNSHRGTLIVSGRFHGKRAGFHDDISRRTAVVGDNDRQRTN